jgi:hypothetical protein
LAVDRQGETKRKVQEKEESASQQNPPLNASQPRISSMKIILWNYFSLARISKGW